MLISHPLEWQEFHTHLMKTDGIAPNYVETSEHWANLDAIMDFYTKNPVEGKWRATNSWNLFHRRYLTPAAVTCYWRRLMISWAEVQGFTPKLWERDREGKRRMRGMPFAAFAANWPADPQFLP
jgi:hypothetical protein